MITRRDLFVPVTNVVNKDLALKAKAKNLTFKAKAKDLALKAEAKAKDSKYVLENSSRPRTMAKDNNTASNTIKQPPIKRDGE